MYKQYFWSVVDESRKDCTSTGEQNRRYQSLLEALTPAQILEFRRLLEEQMIEAYHWDLWGAAALINDGCSAAGFEGFRAWLIAQGRATFEAALRDPETLVNNDDCQDGSAGYPAFLSIPGAVYKSKTQQWMPDLGITYPKQPAGRKFVEDLDEINENNVEALTRRFPRLAKEFKRDEWFTDRTPAEYHPAPPLQAVMPPMGEERFWELIEESRRRAQRRKPANGDQFFERQLEEMPDVLRQLTPAELIAYDRRFNDYRKRAYRWDLWGAAYWMHGGCGDDGFIDFRSTLITLGKELFFQVLNDPDCLADLIERRDVPSYLAVEGFQYLALRVYSEKTGYDAMPDMPDEDRGPAEPEGHEFDFDSETLMRTRYPRLVAKFPEMGD